MSRYGAERLFLVSLRRQRTLYGLATRMFSSSLQLPKAGSVTSNNKFSVPNKTTPLREFVKAKKVMAPVGAKMFAELDEPERRVYAEKAKQLNAEIDRQPLWKRQLNTLLLSEEMKQKQQRKKEKLTEKLVNQLGKPRMMNGLTLFSQEATGERLSVVRAAKYWNELSDVEKEKFKENARQINQSKWLKFEKNVRKVCPELYCELLPKAQALSSRIQLLEEEQAIAVKAARATGEELSRLREEGLVTLSTASGKKMELSDKIQALDKHINRIQEVLKRAKS